MKTFHHCIITATGKSILYDLDKDTKCNMVMDLLDAYIARK